MIALAGLATSHPYTDARTLAAGSALAVWEPDAERLARFRAEHPDAEVFADLSSLLDAKPDGVVLTVPTPQVAPALAAVLDRDLPCFVNKPAAATAGQLAALDPVVARAPHRVLSSSVLRFAPSFEQFRSAVRSSEVLTARATVRHSVQPWAEGLNPWQDDPSAGGGTLVTMGIHGVELLVALLGPEVAVAGAVSAIRRYRTLRSEDTGIIALGWTDGPVGAVEILGVTDGEAYAVTVETAEGTHAVTLTGGDDPETALGYRGTIAAFLGMVAGEPSPVRWTETRAVLSVLAAARAMTR
ncbi:MAG: Gfo/Idh/MocA family oxidoreductase [Hamadaea sp.]|uniref:Gfo/Idh/MocA family protein n=1 Tax=Hamadaea sp. TaxID=2024425 RepID=UPI0017E12FD2|nr:Gfo/Idh/MocA family oxidoreductase [Hamadaea sp.]NUR74306.1 Gfo/Idh/MocA family oxidoreductase [Hamadaea sp.]NUT24303.1 Gfo/Idh/MocA family oxidoreductase [Hamadaea sp.]